MKLVYYATIVLVIPIMRGMMLLFIMLRLGVVVTVGMPMHGIRRGELYYMCLFGFNFDMKYEEFRLHSTCIPLPSLL
jgi:hypothetical protein